MKKVALPNKNKWLFVKNVVLGYSGIGLQRFDRGAIFSTYMGSLLLFLALLCLFFLDKSVTLYKFATYKNTKIK